MALFSKPYEKRDPQLVTNKEMKHLLNYWDPFTPPKIRWYSQMALAA